MILTVCRGVREISADAGRPAALAIAGSADAAVRAAAAAIAGLAAGSSRARAATHVPHGHAELGSQGRLGIRMGDDAAATAAASTAAAAAAAAGSRCRGTVDAAPRKRHQGLLIAQADPAAAAAAFCQLTLQLQQQKSVRRRPS